MGFWVAAVVYFAWFAIMLSQFHLANQRARNDIRSRGIAPPAGVNDHEGATSPSIV
jgi:hypothetical protein